MTSPTTGGSVSQRLSATFCTSCVHSLTRLRRRVCWDTGGPSMTNSKGIGISVGFSLRLLQVSVPCYPPAPMSFNPQVVCTPTLSDRGCWSRDGRSERGGRVARQGAAADTNTRCPARADAGPACPLPMEADPRGGGPELASDDEHRGTLHPSRTVRGGPPSVWWRIRRAASSSETVAGVARTVDSPTARTTMPRAPSRTRNPDTATRIRRPCCSAEPVPPRPQALRDPCHAA